MDAGIVASIEMGSDYLCARFSGRYSTSPEKGYIPEIAKACRQYGALRVLVDITGIVGRIDLWRYFRQVDYLSSLLPPRVRVALVALPEQVELDHFIESAAMNHGLALRQFTDLEEAIEWLRDVSVEQGWLDERAKKPFDIVLLNG